MANKVFIATSLDGYIADENGGIDWLTNFPGPKNHDGGFAKFISGIDAIVMGRNTYEKVLSFGIEWPYTKKVFVLTHTLKNVDPSLETKVELVNGDLRALVQNLNAQGFKNLYIDGGNVIQGFLRENLIDELIITQVPILLGKGILLFENVPRLTLQHLSSEAFDNGMVQNHYKVSN